MALAEPDELSTTTPMVGVWGRPILVAVGDPAHAGDLALVAAALAARSDGSVVVFTVEPAALSGDSELTPALRGAAGVVDRYRVPYRVEVDHRRLSPPGPARARELAWTISSRARRWDAESIVVGVPVHLPQELQVHRHLSVGGGTSIVPIVLGGDRAEGGRTRLAATGRLARLDQRPQPVLRPATG